MRRALRSRPAPLREDRRPAAAGAVHRQSGEPGLVDRSGRRVRHLLGREPELGGGVGRVEPGRHLPVEEGPPHPRPPRPRGRGAVTTTGAGAPSPAPSGAGR